MTLRVFLIFTQNQVMHWSIHWKILEGKYNFNFLLHYLMLIARDKSILHVNKLIYVCMFDQKRPSRDLWIGLFVSIYFLIFHIYSVCILVQLIYFNCAYIWFLCVNAQGTLLKAYLESFHIATCVFKILCGICITNDMCDRWASAAGTTHS